MLDLALFENTYLQDLREANRVFGRMLTGI